MLISQQGTLFAAERVVKADSNISGDVINTKGFVIELDYDYQIKVDSDSVVKLYENGVLVSVEYEVNGSVLEISKSTNYLPKKAYRLVVRGIKSLNHTDVVLEEFYLAFRYSSYQKFLIGRSVRGRGIEAFSIGEGDHVFLMIGAMHGDEKNTGSLVHQLMKNFRSNLSLIPNGTKLIFVPILNPDGHRSNSRFNANQVDLNRNSGSEDWQRVTYVGTRRYPNGGGSSPNSERETKAIQKLINKYDPYFTVSYHSAGSFAITNGPDSRTITRSYALKSKYEYVDQSSGGTAYSYPITGDLTIWMYERGYKAMTVELKTRDSVEFNVNFKALKHIVSSYSPR